MKTIERQPTRIDGEIAPKSEEEAVPIFEKKKFMFRYSDPILNKWDTFIILIAIYN
jgi:hypothetical protein